MGPAPARHLQIGYRTALIGAAAALTCACASLPVDSPLQPPPVADSPVRRQVLAASNAEGRYPKLTQIPRAPLDVRPTRAWSRSIYDVLRLRRQLLIEAAVAGPPPSDTESWAAKLRREAAEATSSARASAANSTNSFVEGGRDRATAPSSAR
jgi:hypothetical protein